MEIPELLKNSLMEAGIDEAAIEVIGNEAQAVDSALEMASEGDLLVIFGDNAQRCWKQIIYFNEEERSKSDDGEAESHLVNDDLEEIFTGNDRLIRDERGVRLARDEVEDSD